MNIGKAASLSGLSIKTVRYYSDIGIIEPDIHSDTGYRIFSSNDVAKLQFIGKARKFNFGIEECRELLALYENKGSQETSGRAPATVNVTATGPGKSNGLNQHL